MMSALWELNEERLDTFDLTNPIVYGSSSIVYKGGVDESANFLSLLRVYTPRIWLLTLSICLLISIVFTMNTKMVETQRRRDNDGVLEEYEGGGGGGKDHVEVIKGVVSAFSESFWTVSQFVTDQCSTIPFNHEKSSNTARLLLSILGIFSIFFLRLYEGGLLTSLMLQKEHVPFRSSSTLADRVRRKESTYIILESSYLEVYLNDPKAVSFRPMQEAVKVNPPLLIYNPPDNMVNQVLKGSVGEYAFGFVTDDVGALMSMDCSLRYVLDPDVPMQRTSWIMKQNQTLTRLLNQQINRQLSFIQQTIARYTRNAGARRDCPVPDNQTLRISNLYGIFTLSGMLCVLSTLMFLYELYRGQVERMEEGSSVKKWMTKKPPLSSSAEMSRFSHNHQERRFENQSRVFEIRRRSRRHSSDGSVRMMNQSAGNQFVGPFNVPSPSGGHSAVYKNL